MANQTYTKILQYLIILFSRLYVYLSGGKKCQLFGKFCIGILPFWTFINLVFIHKYIEHSFMTWQKWSLSRNSKVFKLIFHYLLATSETYSNNVTILRSWYYFNILLIYSTYLRENNNIKQKTNKKTNKEKKKEERKDI